MNTGDPLGLVVPIRLEALLIGEGDAHADDYFLPPYANFSFLPYAGGGLNQPYLSNLVMSQPFTGTHTMEQGTHLHWNLPRALRAGDYGNGGDLSIPFAPDRWLISQIIVDGKDPKNPAVRIKSWVVESDFQFPEATYSRTTIPLDPMLPQKTFAYMGRVYDYEDWLANGNKGTYFDDLTATGFGVPDFSSYYPNCRNVFGIVDESLNDGSYDPQTMSLAYSVIGWYQDPKDDPLYEKQISGTENEFGWRFDNPSGTPPTFSLYQGFVYSVNWNSNRGYKYLPDYKTPISPYVVVGNTPMEAFSALAAEELKDEPLENVESILNALQLGLLQALGQSGGLAEVEEGIYSREYAGVDGGSLWDIKPTKQAPTQNNFDPLTLVSDEVDDELADLNTLQQERNDLAETAVSLQSQIFADWYKFMLIFHTAATGWPNASSSYKFITLEIKTLDGIIGPVGTLADLDQKIGLLVQKIQSKLPADVELVNVTAPRYFLPTDPVILLSGDGVPLPSPDDAPAIQCLLTNQLASAINLPDGLVPGSIAISLASSKLPTISNADKLPFPVVAAQIQTDLLQLPATTNVVSAAIAALGGLDNPATIDFNATTQAIQAAQLAFLAHAAPTNGIAFSGLAPATLISFRSWLDQGEPWHPIALSWRFLFNPLAAVGSTENYPSTFVLDNFDFSDDSFDYRLKSLSFDQDVQSYDGSVLLSSNAVINLKDQIYQYLQYVDDPELEEIYNDLDNYPTLTQALGGFNLSLLMLDQTMQMPVADPIGGIYTTFSNSTVPMAVDAENKVSPLTSNDYNPIRAGKFKLAEIILTDEFGRYREVDLEKIVFSETLPTIPNEPDVFVPPLRVCQPGRLDFDWLLDSDPKRKTTSLPSSNPICGWIVPNNLDDSLMFYDVAGDSIGTLTPSDNDTAVLWQTAPGAGPADQSMDDAFAGKNTVLSGFAFSVRNLGPQYLKALIETFDKTQVYIAPKSYDQNSSIAVLVGSPLAIVQTALDLKLAGLPSPNQDAHSFSIDVERDEPLVRVTRDFPDIRFPLLLGSLSRLDDGLIGFFCQQGGDPNKPIDFETFYAASGAADPHIKQPEADTVTLSFADSAPTTLTLLIDPRCGVHAYTGILPVQDLVVPPDVYNQALKNMWFTFLTSPILRTAGELQLPLPTEANGTWSWVTYADNQWVEVGTINPVNPNATLRAPQQIVEGWLKLKPKE